MLREVTSARETKHQQAVECLRALVEALEADAGNEWRHPTSALAIVQQVENGAVIVYGTTDNTNLLGIIERGKHELLKELDR